VVQLEKRKISNLYEWNIQDYQDKYIENVHDLRLAITKNPNCPSSFRNSDELSQVYIFMRAFDIFFYGEKTANATFPELPYTREIVTSIKEEITELVEEKPMRIQCNLHFGTGQSVLKNFQERAIAEISYSPQRTRAKSINNNGAGTDKKSLSE
jgi:hypothetical protein